MAGAKEVPTGQQPSTRPTPDALSGTWLVDSVAISGQSKLASVWTSRLVITGHFFALSHYVGLSKDLTGTLALRPDAGIEALDVAINAFDLSEIGESVKYPACTLPAIYRIEGDRMTLCMQFGSGRKRPRSFDTADRQTAVLTLVRVHARFQGFPKDVVVTVRDPDGKPVVGATLFDFMSRMEFEKNKGTNPPMRYHDVATTTFDGTARVPYESLATGAAAARDDRRKLVGFADCSPASLRNGAVTIHLAPGRRMTGALFPKDHGKTATPAEWTNVYLLHGGQRVGEYSSFGGQFAFDVAPGNYTLVAYGSNLLTRTIPITVPLGSSEFRLPPIELTLSNLASLQGHPAPEFDGVVGWKNGPVKLADLRGKLVLVDFWGYWCGPCVHEMPVLIELFERFHDRGLMIIGVHLDVDGEVDTSAKLDEKIRGYKAALWRGKELPFPIALTSGKFIDAGGGQQIRGGAAAQYGILGYPTTLLIDRNGTLVGEFDVTDVNAASKAIEELLKSQKVGG